MRRYTTETTEEWLDLKQFVKDNRIALWFAFGGLVLGWFFWWTFNGECTWHNAPGRADCDLKTTMVGYFGFSMVAHMLSFSGALALLVGIVDAMLAGNRRDKDTEQTNALMREFIREQRKFNESPLEALNGIREATERVVRPPADP